MLVRTAKISDLDAICRLADAINEEHHAHAPTIFAQPPGTDADQSFWESLILGNDSIFLVAQKEDGSVGGFVTAKFVETTVIPFLKVRKVCQIGTIVVLPTSRREGIGRYLFQAIKKLAIEDSAAEIRLEVFDFNRSAQVFYEAEGFKVQSHILTRSLVDDLSVAVLPPPIL